MGPIDLLNKIVCLLKTTLNLKTEPQIPYPRPPIITFCWGTDGGGGEQTSCKKEMRPGALLLSGQVGENPPTPVERIDGSPQLGLPPESLIKAKGCWHCYFLVFCARCASVFGSFVLKIWNVSLFFADVGTSLLGVWVGPSAMIL